MPDDRVVPQDGVTALHQIEARHPGQASAHQGGERSQLHSEANPSGDTVSLIKLKLFSTNSFAGSAPREKAGASAREAASPPTGAMAMAATAAKMAFLIAAPYCRSHQAGALSCS